MVFLYMDLPELMHVELICYTKRKSVSVLHEGASLVHASMFFVINNLVDGVIQL